MGRLVLGLILELFRQRTRVRSLGVDVQRELIASPCDGKLYCPASLSFNTLFGHRPIRVVPSEPGVPCGFRFAVRQVQTFEKTHGPLLRK